MSETILAAVISAAAGVVVALIGAWATVRAARAARAAEAPPTPAGLGAPKPPAPTEAVPPPRRQRGPGVLILIGVALIGAAVVLVVLYAAGVVGRHGQPPKSREEQIRDSVQVRVSKSATPVGLNDQKRPVYENALWLEAPRDVLDEIVKVTYNFENPKYRFSSEPRRVSTDRADRFKHVYIGVGPWTHDMEAILTLRDGKEVVIPFNMSRTLYGE
jgi:hypothetical protein